jgi:glycine hydroxymethyltransferase
MVQSHLLHGYTLIATYDAANSGTKLKDFVAAMKSDGHQSEIARLRHDVEEYAKQFPTVGFEKETMKYKD